MAWNKQVNHSQILKELKNPLPVICHILVVIWEHIRLPGPGTQDPGPITRYPGPGSGETGPVTRDPGPMKQGT